MTQSPTTALTPVGLGVFNPTIATITLRALFGRRRRFLLLLGLPVLLLGLAALSEAAGAGPSDWLQPVALELGLGVVLPVLALIIGTGVLGAEIDDGTLAHVLAKPLPRRVIVLTKLAVAVAVTAVTAGGTLALVGLFAGDGRLALGLLLGAVVGSLAYCAMFGALSLLTRRPVLVGLAYVLLWEGTLLSVLRGAANLSVAQYTLTVVDRVSGSALVNSTVPLSTAMAMTFVFTVGFTLLAIDRLRSFSVKGETS